MNFNKEFSMIRGSFQKVREDITFLSNKIYENYDEFMKHHLKLVHEVKEISEKINDHKKSIADLSDGKLSDKKISNLTLEIKGIKNEINEIQDSHLVIEKAIDEISENKKNIKELKEKYQNSELEIYLLKERLLEKDAELKQIKEINKHMFNAIEDLSEIEAEISRRKNS